MGTKPQHHRRYAPVPAMLRRMREEAGLSQRAFAARGGWTQNFVQTSETGSRRVDFAEFVVWAQACGKTPVEALTEYLATLPRAGVPAITETHETSPAYGTKSPPAGRVRKAKDLLRRALKELGEA